MSKQLPILIKWFNNLEDTQRDDLVKHINSEAFLPEKENFEKFKLLRNEIVNLITTGQEKDSVLKKLTVVGMEEKIGDFLFKYCSSMVTTLQE
ncbi:MAG: hypothetical protein WA125_14770, partial [Desulfosporosinus sp.]